MIDFSGIRTRIRERMETQAASPCSGLSSKAIAALIASADDVPRLVSSFTQVLRDNHQLASGERGLTVGTLERLVWVGLMAEAITMRKAAELLNLDVDETDKRFCDWMQSDDARALPDWAAADQRDEDHRYGVPAEIPASLASDTSPDTTPERTL